MGAKFVGVYRACSIVQEETGRNTRINISFTIPSKLKPGIIGDAFLQASGIEVEVEEGKLVITKV